MSDQDIFEENKADQLENKNVAPSSKVDLFADKLMAITNKDGKPKYDSIEKALDALAASQEHIERLEAEAKERNDNLKALEGKVNEAASLNEVIRQLNEDRNVQKEPGTPPTAGLSEQQIKDLVLNALNEDKQVNAAIGNVQKVQEKLLDKFGERGSNDPAKTKAAIKAKADSLGISPKDFKELSAKNPQLVLALFEGGGNTAGPSTSSINLSGQRVTDPEIKMPEKSLISGLGATDKNRKDLLEQIRAKVYKEFEVS